METGAPQVQHTSQEGPSRGQRHPRPRRGRGGNHNPSLAFRPASVTPDGQPPSLPSFPSHASSQSHDSPSTSSRGRGRGRGRGGRAAQDRTVNGRQFGGQLTQPEASGPIEATQSSQSLQADAPAFVPGQQFGQRQPQARQPRPQKRRPSKSQAPDIATRTHEDIDHGHYECPICTSEVRRSSKVWSCHTCWTVFHLPCIKKWSSNEGSAASQQQAQDGQTDAPRQWRCPGCNLPKDEKPNLYACWCGKEIDPKPLAGLPPHSCGNTCGKERAKKCPHPCELTCHAGPCPPCSHMGPTQMCFCGKHEVTKRCSETDYITGWSCGEICGEVMPCGEHTCPRPCHEGLCGVCEVRVPARCYCGQTEKDILCADRGNERDSYIKHANGDAEDFTESWLGSFNCENVCGRAFDCGEHHCQKECHTQSAEPGHCPRSPDVVSHCPCGRTPLAELTSDARQKCTDPIRYCQQTCGKILACEHEDEKLCHTGDCAPCMKTVQIKCRCGRTTSNTICHQGKEEPPQCPRTCKVLLNCGRHNCDERCCPGERKAAERQSTKRKQRPLGSAREINDGFEAEHICTMPCGRLLKCGTHLCQELCHRGPCGTCREAIFDEISCHCGRTVLQPPLPCGTKPPPCRYPCNRPKQCGHPTVAHNCHGDDEACPKCPYLTEKRCMCGKKNLKNQQCWLNDVRCGEVCGKTLRCGSHHCRKTCHRPEECEDADGKACQQPCMKEKKICGHPDMENLCHAPFPCKEDKPCQSQIFIFCACQAQKQEMKCGASKNNEGNAGKTLPCNDECARLERNRKLAMALDIDQSAHVDGGDHIPYSADTLNIFASHFNWAQTQEREFRVFASSPEEKRLRFKPMKSHQRAFIHSLAEDYGLDSEAMDPEPHRHVMIWKTPRFVSAPSKTLAEALRIRTQAQRSATASANASNNESTKKTTAKPASVAPFNAFVIAKPKFGLTIDELRAEIERQGNLGMALTFDIEFLPTEEVVLKAISRTVTGLDLQQLLQSIRNQLVAAIADKGYGTAELCACDISLKIVRRESDGPSGDGWSKVAAKRAMPRVMAPSAGVTGSNNLFAALGDGKVTFAKKKPAAKAVKPKQEDVVDDWEAAASAEEEKEAAASAGREDEAPTMHSDEVAQKVNPAVQDVQLDETMGKPEDDGEQQPTDWASQVEQAEA